jgi:hypothetical protein
MGAARKATTDHQIAAVQQRQDQGDGLQDDGLLEDVRAGLGHGAQNVEAENADKESHTDPATGGDSFAPRFRGRASQRLCGRSKRVHTLWSGVACTRLCSGRGPAMSSRRLVAAAVNPVATRRGS